MDTFDCPHYDCIATITIVMNLRLLLWCWRWSRFYNCNNDNDDSLMTICTLSSSSHFIVITTDQGVSVIAPTVTPLLTAPDQTLCLVCENKSQSFQRNTMITGIIHFLQDKAKAQTDSQTDRELDTIISPVQSSPFQAGLHMQWPLSESQVSDSQPFPHSDWHLEACPK